MIYQINELTAEDVLLIGEALDLLPHGRVQTLVAKMQAQINAQEIAARDKVTSLQNDSIEVWRQQEREKLKAEIAKQSPKSRKRSK